MNTPTPALSAADAETLRRLRAARDLRWITWYRAARRRGYPLQSLADALGVSRQRMHAIEHRHNQLIASRQLKLPPLGDVSAPRVRFKPRGPRPIKRTLPVEERARLVGLFQLSTGVRHHTPADDPSRVAGTALYDSLEAMLADGWSLTEIARETGITMKALRGRVVRRRKS